MLDTFIEVAYAKEAQAETEKRAIALLKQLPASDLLKLTQGEKLAWLEPSASGQGQGSFLEKFQGSPLFEQAIALEQEELQAETTDIERRKEQRAAQQMDSGLWDARDEIRVKKRLLELQLAQEQAGVGAAEPPMDAAPMPAPVDVAPTPAPAEAVEPAPAGPVKAASIRKRAQRIKRAMSVGNVVKMTSVAKQKLPGLQPLASKAVGQVNKQLGNFKSLTSKVGSMKRIKRAMSAGDVVNMASVAKKLPGAIPSAISNVAKAAPSGALGQVNKQLGNFSSLTRKVGSIDKAMFARADAWGRELAQSDFTKAAHAADLEQAATEAGHTLAHGMRKEALGGLAGMALNYAKNPKNLGAVVGAGVGAVGGLAHGLRPDQQGQTHLLGGLAEGIGGAALGAGAGHAAQGIGRGMKGGVSFGDSARAYGKGLGVTPGAATVKSHSMSDAAALGHGGSAAGPAALGHSPPSAAAATPAAAATSVVKAPRARKPKAPQGTGAPAQDAAGASSGTIVPPAPKRPSVTAAPQAAPSSTPADPSIQQIQEAGRLRTPPPLPYASEAAFSGAAPSPYLRRNLVAPKVAHAFRDEGADVAGRILAQHRPPLTQLRAY